MRLKRPCLLFFWIILVSQSGFSQQLKIILGEANISLLEEYKITLVIPKDLKKEYQSFPYSSFPEFDGLVKFKTEYTEDKEAKVYKIVQCYLPEHSGKVQIPAFRLKVGDQTVSSPGKQINVKAGDTRIKQAFPENLNFGTEEESFKFLISSDNSEIFTSEGFVVSASLLIGVNNKVKYHFKNLQEQAHQIATALSPSNCLMDENSPGIIQNPSYDSVTIGNKNYKRLKLFEARYYPVNSEDINFGEIKFELVKYLIAKASNVVWWEAKDLKLTSSKLKIKVKELPAHPLRDVAPVGNFQLKESVNSNKIITGNTLHYTAIIRGNGNLDQVIPPLIRENNLFDVYSARTRHRIVREKNNFAGKIFEFTIIPKEPGRYHLSEYFKWIYFNPETKKYDTLRSQIAIQATGESLKNKEITSSYSGSFYELAAKESNKLRSKEKDETIKFFANIIILFMLVSTAILVFKK